MNNETETLDAEIAKLKRERDHTLMWNGVRVKFY